MLTDDFRTRQAAADLLRVPGSTARPGSGPDVLNERDGVRLCAAFAARVANALTIGRIDPLLVDLWGAKSDHLRRAPAPIRAALMNGVQRLADLNLLALPDGPSPAELLSMPLQGLAKPLIAIARRMTSDERDHVARADYGCDSTRHRSALEALLDNPSLAYPDTDAWYPAEVVELVSHVPGQPGHVPCLAIVLLDALRTGDARGNAEFRLGQQAAAIAGLAPPVRDTFHAAFRHLYESIPLWSPPLPAPFTLPWASPPQS